jgi:hypothetical protein
MVAKPEAHSVNSLLKMRATSSSDVEYYIEVPTFQRGLVWSDEKKRNLISSIYRGFPIGSLLLYVSNDLTSDGRRNAQIIDGLQRSTAILDYASKPLKFAPVADQLVKEECKASILRIFQEAGGKVQTKDIRDAINQWAIETGDTKTANGFKVNVLIERLLKKIDVELSSQATEELEQIIDKDVIDQLSEEFKKIDEYKIPVVVYSGSEDDLPEIFESLNSGTPLTKYDKFGATWSNYKVITKTEAIRTAIKDRYSVYLDKGWEVEGYVATQDIGENDLNLFEYLTGLGKILSDENPCLFSALDKNSETSSAAFVLATVAHGLRINDMSQLPRILSQNGTINLTQFEAALRKTCSDVNTKLQELLALKMNQRSPSDRFLPHSENQVLSIVLRLLIENYDVTTWKSLGGKNDAQLLLENIQTHYVRDIIGEAWRGSGDSTLYERVWIKNEGTGALSKSGYYISKPQFADVKQQLTSHFESELAKQQTNRSNISTKSKLLLRVLYTDIITFRDNALIQFDIEHLAPVKALGDLIVNQKLTNGLPISCIGNLAILPTDLNIIKGKNYVGDHIRNNPTDFDQDKVSKINSYVIDPDSSDITQANIDSEKDYINFVQDRFEKQLAIILKNLGY